VGTNNACNARNSEQKYDEENFLHGFDFRPFKKFDSYALTNRIGVWVARIL